MLLVDGSRHGGCWFLLCVSALLWGQGGTVTVFSIDDVDKAGVSLNVLSSLRFEDGRWTEEVRCSRGTGRFFVI